MYDDGIRFGMNFIDRWCKENIKHKYRYDYISIIKRSEQWEIKNTEGDARVVFAFQDKHDYTLFALRWSSAKIDS